MRGPGVEFMQLLRNMYRNLKYHILSLQITSHFISLRQYGRYAISGDDIDIETKAKRGSDPLNFSISKRNQQACSKKFKIEEER